MRVKFFRYILALSLIVPTSAFADKGTETRFQRPGGSSSGGVSEKERALQLGIQLLQDAIRRELNKPGPTDVERLDQQRKALDREKARLRKLMDEQLREMDRVNAEIERKRRMREQTAERERLERLGQFKETGSKDANPWQASGIDDLRTKCITWQLREKRSDEDFDRCMKGGDISLETSAPSANAPVVASGDAKATKTLGMMPIKQGSNEKGYDINPVTKEYCVTVKALEPEQMKYSSSIKYRYEINNSCRKSYTVKMHTNAGWTGLSNISGNGKPGSWFCTDGFRGNKDCKGGISGYSY